MDKATCEAFRTPWELCSPEQRALREKHLPRKPEFDYETALVERYAQGLPLSKHDAKRVRQIIRSRKA